MRRALKLFGLPALSGLLLAWCFPTAHLYFLVWIALVPLVYASAGQKPWMSATQWLLAGWLFHSVLLQWLASNIFWAGGWAIFGYQFLVLALAVIWAGMGALFAIVHRRAPQWSPLLLAGLFVTTEWMHANLLTGMGWSAVAYSQGPDLALLQCAALGGTAVIAFVTVYVNAAVGLFFAQIPFRWAHLVAAPLLALLAHGLGGLMLGAPDITSQPLRAGVFQSNYTNQMKWDGEFTLDMVERAARHSATLEEFNPVDLMVWPEALIMQDVSRYPVLIEPVLQYAATQKTTVFTGAVRYADGNSYNSSLLIAKDGTLADYYDKVHLAPFGEYVPFEKYLAFVQQVVQSSVDAGEAQKVVEADGIRIGPLICFEVLFSPMAMHLRDEGARVLTVITNLAWFGWSNAIYQEIEIARVRAIETRLPLIHASNTGVSGVIDPWGRLKAVDSWVLGDGRISQRESEGSELGLTHRRALGAFDVPAPVQQPLPWGPAWFPIGVMALTALGLAAAIAAPWWNRRQAPRVEPVPSTPERPFASHDDISI